MKKSFFFLAAILIIASSCGIVQSIVKSTFPYTTTVVIPASSQPGNEYSAVSLAKSFDQSFSKDGNTASKVSKVHITSAKLEASSPSDFNIGNLSSIKIYFSDEDGKNEVLVASRTDLGPNVGNNVVLDIDNSHTLDQYVRMPKIKVHMVYKVRNGAGVDVILKLTLGLNAKAS